MGLPVRISIRCQGNSQKLWYNNYISCKFKEIISYILGDKVLSITKYIYIYNNQRVLCILSITISLQRCAHVYYNYYKYNYTLHNLLYSLQKSCTSVHTHTQHAHTNTQLYACTHIIYTRTVSIVYRCR